MDALVAVSMAARLGGQAFIFSDCCSDAQHDPCQVRRLVKGFGVNHRGFSFISYLAPIVQRRELRETCPGSAPTDAWKPDLLPVWGVCLWSLSTSVVQSGDLAVFE